MRKATLDLLRCPRCGAGSLVPDQRASVALFFGPARCLGCSSRFPVHEGLVDFVGERGKVKPLQQAMEIPWVARSWDRYLRPAVDAVLTRGRLDLESEYAVVHNFMGAPNGPVVDLGCGSGLFLRRLSRDFEDQHVIGVDLSRPMLEEAMAQAREHGEAADFVRAEVPPLPFVNHCVGAIVATGFLHYVSDLDTLLREAARVLKPRGRIVATTYEAAGVVKPVHRTAGLFPRSEAALRESAAKAGLIHFERMRLPPFVIWKAELP